MVKIDGFDKAVIGLTHIRSVENPVIVYDAKKIIDILMKHDEMSYEEAIKYFEFKMQGTYVGGQDPLFVFLADLKTIEQLSEAIDG